MADIKSFFLLSKCLRYVTPDMSQRLRPLFPPPPPSNLLHTYVHHMAAWPLVMVLHFITWHPSASWRCAGVKCERWTGWEEWEEEYVSSMGPQRDLSQDVRGLQKRPELFYWRHLAQVTITCIHTHTVSTHSCSLGTDVCASLRSAEVITYLCNSLKKTTKVFHKLLVLSLFLCLWWVVVLLFHWLTAGRRTLPAFWESVCQGVKGKFSGVKSLKTWPVTHLSH